MQFIPIVAVLALMYLLLIRPQQQRVKRQRDLLGALTVGDGIVTVGGIVGTIVGLATDTVDVQVADGVVVTFVRPAISRKAPPAADAVADTDTSDTSDTSDTKPEVDG